MLCQLEIPVATTMYALKVGKEEGVMTVLNTAPVPDDGVPDEIWTYCDIVCPNETELHRLTGMPTSSNEEIIAAAEHLKGRGVRKLVVTLGERGAAIFEFDVSPVFVPGIEVTASDTSGAGDSFLGAFANFITIGESLLSATTLACRVASISVTREGTQSSFPYATEVAGER